MDEKRYRSSHGSHADQPYFFLELFGDGLSLLDGN
jgi:hypothetical protein